jgi:hypothetical protein
MSSVIEDSEGKFAPRAQPESSRTSDSYRAQSVAKLWRMLGLGAPRKVRVARLGSLLASFEKRSAFRFQLNIASGDPRSFLHSPAE